MSRLLVTGREVSESLLDVTTPDLVQNPCDAHGEFRSLELRFMEQRRGWIADLNQLAGDSLDDAFVLIGEEPNQRSDLTVADLCHGPIPTFYRAGASPLPIPILRPVLTHPIARRNARALP